MATGTVPTDQTGSVDSDTSKNIMQTWEYWAFRAADIAQTALASREGTPDRGTGGGNAAGENGTKAWWQQPAVLIAAAAVVLVLFMRRR